MQDDKIRPIIFTGESVRAILEGRKTQTRRVMNPQPPFAGNIAYPSPTVEGAWNFRSKEHRRAALSNLPIRCPYGQTGDRLWVREAFDWIAGTEETAGVRRRFESLVYRADGGSPCGDQWTSPLHMPRWASRLTLEIVSVRVERLQEISEEDAYAEGCFALGDADCTAIRQFQILWDKINGKKHPWKENPWVWALTFKIR